jgi:hypothetical protein
MSLFAMEKMFICVDCRHWWTQEASFFGTYNENPEHTCEACGGQGEEADEDTKNSILPGPTDYTNGAAMFEAEIMAAENEQHTDTEADAEADVDAGAGAEAAGAEI